LVQRKYQDYKEYNRRDKKITILLINPAPEGNNKDLRNENKNS